MGNAWADFFAKLGALDVAVADVAATPLQEAIKECKLSCQFLARAVQIICARPDVSGAAPALPQPPKEERPRLVIVAHDTVPLAPGSSALQCRQCLAVARTPASAKSLHKPGAQCEPVPMLRQLAALAEGEAAYAAAAASLGAEAGGSLLVCGGHHIHRAGSFLFCGLCGARVALGSAKIEALGNPCPTAPPNPARRRARDWLSEGRHPATGIRLVQSNP